VGVLAVAALSEYAGLEERLDQIQHAFVLDPATHAVHQGHVVDRVEARLDIRIEHPAITLGAVLVDLGDRVLGSPHRPKPIGDRHEVDLEDRFQHQLQRSLDDPIGHGGDAEFPQLPRPSRFGNLAFPHRQRPKRALLELDTQVIQEPGHPDPLLDVGDRETVHARSSGPGIARDPFKRHNQRRRVVHEVEQVVEPAAGIGRRPTVKFGLHLRYPPTRPQRPLRRCATIRWCLFRHCSLHPFSKLLPPFPMCTGSPRLGVLRRLRPVPDRSADGGPSSTLSTGCARASMIRDGSHVHCDSLDEGGAQLCPCGIATVTPQHVTVASRTNIHKPARKFPAPQQRNGCAPRPAHIHQI